MFNCMKELFLHEGFHEGAHVDTKHFGIYVVPKISSFFDENVEIVNMLSFSSLGRMDKLKKVEIFPSYNLLI